MNWGGPNFGDLLDLGQTATKRGYPQDFENWEIGAESDEQESISW